MSEEPFNARERLVPMRGGSRYLEVRHRKRWFIEENPRYAIDIAEQTISDRIAVFRATVTVYGEGGEIVRTVSDWGSETPGDFGDYIEKAATKALGRALDSLGYGTTAAIDEAEDGPLADAPVPARPLAAPTGDRPATAEQHRAVQRLADRLGYDDERLARIIGEGRRNAASGLTDAQARTLIVELQQAAAADRLARRGS